MSITQYGSGATNKTARSRVKSNFGFTDEIDGELDRELTSNADGIVLKKDEYIGKTSAFSEDRDSTESIMRNAKVRPSVDEYANAEGYGIFCGKKCIERKQAQGILPKGAVKQAEKESEVALNQALAQGLSATPTAPAQSGMSTGAVVGVIIGGLVLLGGLAYMMLRKK